LTITRELGLSYGVGRRYVSAEPISPGDVLKREFLEELGISQRALARAIGVPAMRISEIVRGKRGVTADTAIRLGRYLGTSPEFWLNLQSGWELSLVRQASGKKYSGIQPLSTSP
jgi:addiction module HigA family antidote